MSVRARETVIGEGFAREGDTIAVAAGAPSGQSGTTNLLDVVRV